ncbi:MAG: NAD(P)H-hydrate dehydratase [Proteobacteria bacterium]|nr:NAD(P)H-hydrate dehydratase [Pseudomonadota bacterium]MBU1717064.1 NAD(P)H-hydrate dehydratase [Pseudomonadota bacterium]
MKLATAEQMRRLDAVAIDEYEIPGMLLMENAGAGTVRAIVQHFGNLRGQKIVIFAGPGNNGGDGFVIARHIHQAGGDPIVCVLVDPGKIKGDAATNHKIIQNLLIPIYYFRSTKELATAVSHLKKCHLIVDAIFGTGLTRNISGHFADCIKLINQTNCPVISADIPSGLHSDTGNPLGICVQATLTTTYGLAKVGQIIEQGPKFTGILEVIDISIPPDAIEMADLECTVLDKQEVKNWQPKRKNDAHKGTFGHLLIVAGSRGKTGAAILSGQGALRSGAGLVTICVPATLNEILETSLIEAMTIPLEKSNAGYPVNQDLVQITKAAANKQAMVLGPGLGTNEKTAELVNNLYHKIKIPMVVDADALNTLSLKESQIHKPMAPRIMTPHPGEMSWMTGIPTKEIQENRIEISKLFAKQNGVFLILKGADTIVASPDGRIAINKTGNPGMAAGGMGDVLAGLIGGLLVQGLTPWQASCLGVYAHGLAGDRLAATQKSSFGLLASELAAKLPMVLTKLAC